MAATALIRFTQNAVPGTAGEAYIGATGLAVTVANSDNADVLSWRVDLAYAPPGSALEVVAPGTPTVLGSGNSATPSATFTPDIPGSYRVVLTVYAGAGQTGQEDTDIRNFVVPTANRGIIIPPYQKLPDPLPLLASGDAGAKPDELNYGGQQNGWAGDNSQVGLHRLLNVLDQGTLFSVTAAVTTSPTTVTGGASPRYIPVDTADGSWPGSNGTINVPAGLPVGHTLVVQDTTGAADTKNIVISPQGGETVNGLASIRIAHAYGSATLVKTSASAWILWGAKTFREERTLLAGLATTGLVGFQAVGAVGLNLADFPNLLGVEFRAHIETSNEDDPVEVRLFNSTTASTITGSTLSASGLQPTLVTAPVTLSSGSNIYEIQMRLTVTGEPNQAGCKQSQLILTWLQP